MKKLLILFSILFCLKNMQAQNTCATALNFTVAPFDPVESQTQSAKWYKFTSKSTKVRYKLRFSSNSGSGQPNKIILWGGSCGSLVQMGEDTITSITDSVLEIVNMSISNSTNYYIEIRKLNSTDTVNYFQTLNFRVLSPECTDCPSSSCELLCNGSFEANYGQPVGITNNSASDLSTCGWENFNMASPDYFTTSGTNGAGIPNTLFGNQTARTGNAMTGFFAGSYNGGASHPSGWHEYIYQALQTPLTANVTYTLSFYVKPSTNTSNAGHFANSIGAWFPNSSDLAPNNGPQSINYQILGVTPQVMYNGFINNTSDWTLVTGTFTATGLEEYIVIGNFGSTYNVSNLFKSYYFLDDVSLSTAALCSLSPIGSNNIPNNANVSTQFGGATTLTNQNIKVNGVFNIDANLILVGCNVVMAPDAKINVLNGKSLTIKGKTHVGGCCELWDGIYVQNGGIVNVEESSIIEDANKAIVVAQGGYLNSKVAIFNRNRTSIEFTSNANTTAPAVINTTLFTCRKLPLTATISSNPDFFATLSKLSTYAATTTKPQTVTAIVEKSPYGISATDVNFLSVGTSGIQNYMNYFDQLQIGVNLLRSNCEIYNNTFQNLLNSTVCFGCQNKKGIGVFSQGTAAGTNSITIGGNSVAYQGNSFYNCYRGIELNDYQKNFIIKNTIDNASTSTAIGYGNTGVLIKPANANIVNVGANTITNCNNAVWINRSTTGNINSQEILIENNTITSNSIGFCTNGVNISDVSNTGSTTPVDKIKIQYNTITQAYNCVTATNVKNSLVIRSNTQLQVKNNGTAVNAIKLSSCKGVKIHDNQNINISPVPSPVNTANENFKGIFVTGSTDNQITCNKISNMGESMTFVSLCNNSIIRNNTLDKGNRGFVLRTNGEVGAQGTPNPNGIPCGLWWSSATGDFTAHTYTENTTTANNLSKLYVNSTNAPAGFTGIPSLNLGTGTPYSVGLGGINTVSASPISCGTIIIQMAPIGGGSASAMSNTTTTNETTLLTSLATDATNYPVYEEEHQYNHKKYAFEKLEANGVISSATLQNFYDSAQVETLGKLKQVDNALKLNDAVLASALNNSLTTNNVIENNQKAFNALYFNYLNNNEYVFSQFEKDELLAIAQQCPLEGGSAVWQARVLYSTIENDWIEFADNCDATQRQMQVENIATSETQSDNKFKLYPNPNNGQMILEYNIEEAEVAILYIRDITGKLINTYFINSKNKSTVINENYLDAGIYFYQINIDDKPVKSDKLVIIK